MGWGIGILVSAVQVFVFSGSSSVPEMMIEEERN
jgi:hypothetical protein